ncbi:MAG TPA: aminotransferase class I and II, partial [Chitinophagaceae bacterium]|nr:aminotransferase class I and II [Chitinophagaceae bacterium]
TNMLIWYKELWLIDHGASLYFHHSWLNPEEQAIRPFRQVKDHVLLPFAGELDKVNAEFSAILTSERIRSIVAVIPDEWLEGTDSEESPEQKRQVYVRFLERRLSISETFVNEAKYAREALI